MLGVLVRTVEVPSTRSAPVDGIAHLPELLAVRAAQSEALAATRGPVLTIGGDCGVELAPIAALSRGRKLGVAWFDAHGDLNTPSTSPSGAFHGMVLAALLGCFGERHLSGGRAALIGARALDQGEWPHVWRGLVRHLTVPAARRPGVVSSCLLETNAEDVYLHIDLDVLDPSAFDGAAYRVPGGLTVAELAAGVRAVGSVLPVVGAGITECVTDDPAQLERLVPVIEAVGAVLRNSVARTGR